ICDLSWIWQAAPDHPNLLFDTAWWMPTDLISLFSLVPPGQIVFASDSPYGTTLMSASFQLRLALQAGLSNEQVCSVASRQALRRGPGGPPAPRVADPGGDGGAHTRRSSPAQRLKWQPQWPRRRLCSSVTATTAGPAYTLAAVCRRRCEAPGSSTTRSSPLT